MDSGGGLFGAHFHGDVGPSVAIQTILGGATPHLSIEHLSNGAFVASGFAVLPAKVLLDFCERYSLNCEVLFDNVSKKNTKTFQIHFTYTFAEDEPEKDDHLPATLELNGLNLKENEKSKLASLNRILPPCVHRADIVTFPRVLHVRLFTKSGITASHIDALQRGPSVREVRLGGLNQAVEVIVRRASRFERRKPKRLVRLSDREQVKGCQTRRVVPILRFQEK